MALSSERVRVAHLLRRAGFVAGEQELNEYAALGFDGAVGRLLAYASQPQVASEPPADPLGLAPWWLHRMLHTRRPLEEKMTLFWHGHLTSALREVKQPALMLAQQELLRTNALGSYRDLLRGIARDGAMIEYLDLRSNRKRAPNENYARELLELFTMGIGPYTEDDVQEIARAYTGWSATPDGQFVFNRLQHDYGQKAILGRTGPFDGDDVADLLAAHPATARFMAAKLFRFFAYPDPDEATIERLAGVYLQSDGSIRAVVEAILRSPEFSSERAYRATIKSPTELIVGTLRALGQELFNPPHVAGWFGGRTWINAASLLTRFNATATIAAQLGTPALGGPPLTSLVQGHANPEARVQRVLDLLLDGDVTPEERASLEAYARGTRGDEQIRGLFRLAMALPAYQLN
jgi:uncharacterized protein (DUF1800 family)